MNIFIMLTGAVLFVYGMVMQLTPKQITVTKTISRSYDTHGNMIAEEITSGDYYRLPISNYTKNYEPSGAVVRAAYKEGVKTLDTHAFTDASHNKRTAVVPVAGTYKAYLKLDLDKADKLEIRLDGKNIKEFEISRVGE